MLSFPVEVSESSSFVLFGCSQFEYGASDVSFGFFNFWVVQPCPDQHTHAKDPNNWLQVVVVISPPGSFEDASLLAAWSPWWLCCVSAWLQSLLAGIHSVVYHGILKEPLLSSYRANFYGDALTSFLTHYLVSW